MQNRWRPTAGRLARVEFFNAELNSSGPGNPAPAQQSPAAAVRPAAQIAPPRTFGVRWLCHRLASTPKNSQPQPRPPKSICVCSGQLQLGQLPLPFDLALRRCRRSRRHSERSEESHPPSTPHIEAIEALSTSLTSPALSRTKKISAPPPFKRLHFEPHHQNISAPLQEGSPTMTPAERQSLLEDLDHSREALLRTVDGLTPRNSNIAKPPAAGPPPNVSSTSTSRSSA